MSVTFRTAVFDDLPQLRELLHDSVREGCIEPSFAPTQYY